MDKVQLISLKRLIFYVTGKRGKYVVIYNRTQKRWNCNCGGFTWRGHLEHYYCSHIEDVFKWLKQNKVIV